MVKIFNLPLLFCRIFCLKYSGINVERKYVMSSQNKLLFLNKILKKIITFYHYRRLHELKTFEVNRYTCTHT